MLLWSELADDLRRGERAVLVTVLQTHGSSSREVGGRILVTAAGLRGTIGGGALEWRMRADAEALLGLCERQPMRVVDAMLGPESGQCCGGAVRMLIETFDPADLPHAIDLAEASRDRFKTASALSDSAPRLDRRLVAVDAGPGEEPPLSYDMAAGTIVESWCIPATSVLLYGAGHVGRALAAALEPLPFAVRWIDARPEAFPLHIPCNVAVCGDADPLLPLVEAPAGALIAVMTHSHALDFDIAAAALSDPDRFPFVGLLGSRTKRANFVGRLRTLGLDPERLACPIGLPEIAGKEPAVIAASVAAQLLMLRTRLDAPRKAAAAEAAHA